MLSTFIPCGAHMWMVTMLFPSVISLLFAYFNPYTTKYFNILDSVCFALLSLTLFLIMYTMSVNPLPMQLVGGLVMFPCIYFISFILYKILSRVTLFRTCCSRIAKIIHTRSKNQHLLIQRYYNINNDLPDRILNPHMYQPLFSATDNGERNSQTDCQPQAGVNSLVAYGSM